MVLVALLALVASASLLSSLAGAQEPNPTAPTTTAPTTTAPTTTAPGGVTGPAITTTLTAGKGGEPIEGVVVTVSRDGEQIGRATSGPDGTLTIPVPGSGQYQVTLDKKSLPDGYVDASGDEPAALSAPEEGES